ncbi:NUDIX hydrolase [Gottfriedia solisilvae]|uniref:NUDIX hydrolase n=1 Tax=Gottfriedia solisilvae TaxID=1516104 RepID=UPI003D2EF300
MYKVFTRVLIKDKCNNILVVQDRANAWNFPGGKQEFGESPSECAKREVNEEIGLCIHKLTEICRGEFLFDNIKWRGYFYFANTVSGIPEINELEKIKEIKFIETPNTVNFPFELTKIIKQIFDSNLIREESTFWM